MLDEDIVIPIAFFLMVVVIAIGLPLARAWARRMDRESGQPKVPPEVAERLTRMEQALDAIAVEVERISEGQRFTAQVLAERSRAADRLPTATTD